MTITFDDDLADAGDPGDLPDDDVRAVAQLLHQAASSLDVVERNSGPPEWMDRSPLRRRRRALISVAAAVVVAVGAALAWQQLRPTHVVIGTTPSTVAPTDPRPAGPWFLPTWMPPGQEQLNGLVSRIHPTDGDTTWALARNGDRWVYAVMVKSVPRQPADHFTLAGAAVALTEVPGPQAYRLLQGEECPIEVHSYGLTRAELETAATRAIDAICTSGSGISDFGTSAPSDLVNVEHSARGAGNIGYVDISYSSSSSEHWGMSWSVSPVPTELIDIRRVALAHSLNTQPLRGTIAALNGDQSFNPTLSWVEPGTTWEITVTACCDGTGGGPGPDPLGDVTRFAEGLRAATESELRERISLDEFDDYQATGSLGARFDLVDQTHTDPASQLEALLTSGTTEGGSAVEDLTPAERLALVRLLDADNRLDGTRTTTEWAPRLLDVVARLDPDHLDDYRAELRRWGAQL